MKKFFRIVSKILESLVAFVVALLISPIFLLVLWFDFLASAISTPWDYE